MGRYGNTASNEGGVEVEVGHRGGTNLKGGAREGQKRLGEKGKT